MPAQACGGGPAESPPAAQRHLKLAVKNILNRATSDVVRQVAQRNRSLVLCDCLILQPKIDRSTYDLADATGLSRLTWE